MTTGSTDQQVTDYWLNYRIATDTVRIWVKTNGSSDWVLAKEVSPTTATFVSGLLSSSQAVYFIPGVSLHSKDIKAKNQPT